MLFRRVVGLFGNYSSRISGSSYRVSRSSSSVNGYNFFNSYFFNSYSVSSLSSLVRRTTREK